MILKSLAGVLIFKHHATRSVHTIAKVSELRSENVVGKRVKVQVRWLPIYFRLNIFVHIQIRQLYREEKHLSFKSAISLSNNDKSKCLQRNKSESKYFSSLQLKNKYEIKILIIGSNILIFFSLLCFNT